MKMYNEDLLAQIKEKLVAQQATISVAESVTSGHLQAALSLAKEATSFFQGGITCYNLGQKTKHLDIEPILAENSNCIHQKVAADMALASAKLFISHYAIAITGYASIVPEIEEEGLFAYVAIVHNATVVVQKKITSHKEEQLEVQLDYTNQVLQMMGEYLEGK